MKPLNYAILKHFTKVKEACTEDVIEALKGEYGKFKALNKDDVLNALMTAEANGLLEEAKVELDQAGALKIYYRAHQEGKDAINKYIKD
ncbi:hypothetical protein [Clostridium formicaceticum]|uniref:Uncharacterized protein n=1 Tax=Clostridium formicaceticum TaxID=1497 RepID=A0AAC9RRP5_9CLOT|nr:hypothetical protein [Clostridium formicaceticum]AOY74606.1 hypothetical protein BJL90_00725 [Clostridium formicaceticum]ARE88970.1 hypothetical protein CLFO_33760 [Clostridium formicaceticum]